MKKKSIITMIIGLAICIGLVSPLQATHSVKRINIGSKYYSGKHNMAQRIYTLEQTLGFMQDEMKEMRRDLHASRRLARVRSCYLETPFHGIFTADGPNTGVAKSKVLQRCSSKTGGSIYCKPRKVSCS